MHVDARDFIRGVRPWPQFWSYCLKVANTDGSDLWAAQLRDERYGQAVLDRLKAAGKKQTRPPLEGYTTVVKTLYLIANELRLLTNVTARTNLEFFEGPETVIDHIRASQFARGLEIADAALE
ncbi:MAG: hypothetical protein K2Q25_02435 [Mycobacteriaceae bacterium]|nr:hypothetical protein [Mycobacteriaceae bacterium]